jgi:hypothetical protein
MSGECLVRVLDRLAADMATLRSASVHSSLDDSPRPLDVRACAG